MKSGENDRKKGGHVGSIILHTVTGYGFLSAGILIAVVGAVVLALIPPLVLGDIVDTLTTGSTLPLRMVVFYFIMLAMTGIMESAREGLLTVFGQKITHAVRSSLMEKLIKLSADESVLLWLYGLKIQGLRLCFCCCCLCCFCLPDMCRRTCLPHSLKTEGQSAGLPVMYLRRSII